MTTITQLYEIYLRHPSIQTDTRKLKAGDLFFALKGPSFNGNTFAARALELGAAYAIIDEAPAGDAMPPPYHSDRLIMVPDALATLQQLALHHRRQLNIPFIAITGSNGKTTTKELVHAVLASTFTTYTTVGNLNNHIGVPLTILTVKKDAQFAVIEMGANHQQEIAGYCRYTQPTHGIITNAGLAHLEGFGGPEGVKKGKGELYDYLRANDGTAFVMWDYEYLRTMSKGLPHIIKYGTHDADITGEVERSGPSEPGFPPALAPSSPSSASSSPPSPSSSSSSSPSSGDTFLRVRLTSGETTGIIQTQLVGDYNLPNVLVAVAVGTHFGIAPDTIRQSIASYTPSNSRSQLIERGGNHIILDAYNANPSSMRAAIENFARIGGGAHANAAAGATATAGKVLILGAMAELGADSLAQHQGIVDLIGQYPWQEVLLVGGDFQKLDHPYLRFDDSREAAAWFRLSGLKDSYILIKGSRSTKMEEVLG